MPETPSCASTPTTPTTSTPTTGRTGCLRRFLRGDFPESPRWLALLAGLSGLLVIATSVGEACAWRVLRDGDLGEGACWALLVCLLVLGAVAGFNRMPDLVSLGGKTVQPRLPAEPGPIQEGACPAAAEPLPSSSIAASADVTGAP